MDAPVPPPCPKCHTVRMEKVEPLYWQCKYCGSTERRPLKTRSAAQLLSLHKRLYDRLTCGESWDWPTLRLVFPFYASVLKSIQQRYNRKVKQKT